MSDHDAYMVNSVKDLKGDLNNIQTGFDLLLAEIKGLRSDFRQGSPQPTHASDTTSLLSDPNTAAKDTFPPPKMSATQAAGVLTSVDEALELAWQGQINIPQQKPEGNASKYLRIVDYCLPSIADLSCQDGELVATRDGSFREKSTKIKLEDVSIGMWFYAAIRMASDIQKQDALFTRESYDTYLAYVALQSTRYLWSEVKVFDDRVRHLQFHSKFLWGNTSSDVIRDLKETFLLNRLPPKPKRESSSLNYQLTIRRSQKDINSYPACRKWNMGICSNENCRFDHVCLLPHCRSPRHKSGSCDHPETRRSAEGTAARP